MVPLTYIKLNGDSIYKQLQLEEALLRAHTENICLVNFGSSPSAIVMGISSPVEDHLNINEVKKNELKVIKRFSGGGTVLVDENTFFATFIFNQDALDIQPFPEPILNWSESFYRSVFPFADFSLKENDFVLGEKKIGGNAKYIRKDRWLLHTSFLWDYNSEKMQCLKTPTKRPDYRKNRNHLEFLTCLNKHFESKELLVEHFEKALYQSFSIEKRYESYPDFYLEKPHRKSTEYLKI